MIRVRPRQGALALWRRQPPNFVDVEDDDVWLPPAQRVWLESEQSISTSVDQVADRYAVPLKQVWSQRSTRSQQKRSHQTSRERSKDRAPDVEASVDAAGLDESRMSAEIRVGELELKLREEVAAREKAEQLLRDAQEGAHNLLRIADEEAVGVLGHHLGGHSFRLVCARKRNPRRLACIPTLRPLPAEPTLWDPGRLRSQ